MTIPPEAALALLRRYEGLRLRAYRCPAGQWTIGYGHTGADVWEGKAVTAAQAEALLEADLRQAMETVGKRVRVSLTGNQCAALACFVFNIGAGAFADSTLLKHLNRGWYEQVPAQLLRWTKAAGKDMPGLVARRRAEADLWKTPDISRDPASDPSKLQETR